MAKKRRRRKKQTIWEFNPEEFWNSVLSWGFIIILSAFIFALLYKSPLVQSKLGKSAEPKIKKQSQLPKKNIKPTSKKDYHLENIQTKKAQTKTQKKVSTEHIVPSKKTNSVSKIKSSSNKYPDGGGVGIVIIIDDIGNTDDFQKDLIKLSNQVTYAILPRLPFSKHFAELSRRTGTEVIVHLPLEAHNGQFPGPGVIRRDMDYEEIVRTLNGNLKSVPHHVGVNNHMGSLGTEDRRLMRVLLKNIDKKELFFLDSHTSKDSIVGPLGHDLGIETLHRDVFLDNIDEPEAIRKQLLELANVATKQGVAIGIGHYRKNTFKVLQEELPNLRRDGYRIINLQKAKELSIR